MRTFFNQIILILLFAGCGSMLNAQSTQAGLLAVGHTPGPGGVPIRYVGWDASLASNAIPLSIEHRGTNNINFLTANVPRMTILGSGTLVGSPGFVGIGNNFTAPLFQLDVLDNINVNTTGFLNGYRINGFTVLMTPGQQNVFVGRGSGANFTGATLGENTFVGFNAGGSYITSGSNQGDRNTFVGNAAGFALTSGRHNTMVGCDAGLILATGNSNTFVGEHAGWRQISGDNNVFIGSHAGQGPGAGGTGENNTFVGTFCGPSNLSGDDNTFTGMRAGSACNTGERNCFYGKWAGLTTLNGNENVAMGWRAGRFNKDGNNNTYIGTDAGVPVTITFQNLDNVTALGFDATARASNTMILGNNLVNVGIGLSADAIQNGPQNKLEIDAGLNGTAPQPAGQPGLSGLRFRDLRSVNTPSVANGFCLSVDGNGDVIMVPSAAGTFGGSCAAPSVLNQQTAVDMNGNEVHFLGSSLNSKVGIGDMCNNGIDTKLNVAQASGTTGGTIAGTFVNFDQALGMGNENYGIISICFPFTTSFMDEAYTAGFFRAHGSKLNVGVEAWADGADPWTANFGGRFLAFAGVPGTNIGLYTQCPNNNSDYSAYFDGRIYINGDIEGVGNNNYASDINYKTNLDSIQDALGTINTLRPHTFYYDTLNSDGIRFPSALQYGLIAQDVETILPELVVETTKPAEYDTAGNVVHASVTYKSLNYNAFIAILIQAMQEQQVQMDSLQSQINSCCSYSSRMSNNTNQQDVTLTETKSIVLNQNVPNPFAEQTTISYLLPESVVKAQMLFYDAQGKLIKAVDLEGRGAGQLNVFADDLSNGVYSYALVADGQVIDTKQMVKTK